jgi:formate C-acetyltransferase
MDAFQEAFKKQMRYWMTLMVKGIKVVLETQSQMMHIPFCSSLYEGPLQKGRDVVEGGTWINNCGVYLSGLADAADSFTVIDKLIYRDRSITWDQLIAALRDNWQGHEVLRQFCINGAPKYGNDDDYADSWAIWVVNTWYDCIDELNNRKDLTPSFIPESQYMGAGITGIKNVKFGPTTSALPNGRVHPQPTAECNSPFPGMDRSGPSAVVKSYSKLPAGRVIMGGLMNLRLGTQQLRTDEDIEKFVTFLRSIEELGGYHVQYNVISSELMRKAMKEPEKHRDLLVRVASFMSYFVELTETMQLDIISRTEHNSW